MIRSVLGSLGGGGRKLPGFLFLLRLAWDCKTLLPLLVMSGYMVMGLRLQMEINFNRAPMPWLRFEEEEFPLSDEEEVDDEDYYSEYTLNDEYDDD